MTTAAAAKSKLDLLNGIECHCGRAKEPMRSFCRNCYYKLPTPLRKALYRRIGDGYVEAYEAAVEYLDQRARSAAGGSRP